MSRYEQLALDRQLCFALYSASRAFTRAYAPILRPHGLTYPQYVTLLRLWESPTEPLSMGELGDCLHLDSGTLTPLLKRLEADGWITRRRDATDERRVLIKVTDAGLALRDRLAEVPGQLFAQLGLEMREARALKTQIEQLTARLERLESTD